MPVLAEPCAITVGGNHSICKFDVHKSLCWRAGRVSLKTHEQKEKNKDG